MTATKTASAEWTLAAEITDAAATDAAQAAAIALRASRRFPKFELPAGDGRKVTFAQIHEFFAEQAKAAEPVAAREDSVPTPAPEVAAPAKKVPAPRKAAARKAVPAKKAAPVKVPPVVAAPVKAGPTTLRLVHDGVSQTAIFGIDKGSPANRAIGSAKRDGLGWWFFPGNESFYIPGSQGFAPDYVKINQAIGRLENLLDDDKAPLYRVVAEIATEVDGQPLPVRKSREELKAWQLEYDAAQNAASWQIGMGMAECGTCGAKGLGEKTARLGKGADGMPVVECATCGGFAAPVAAVAPVARMVLALPAAPTLAPVAVAETAECPLCKTVRAVKGGKLVMHSFNGGACRGKLGQTVTDVEPEAAEKPARKTAPRKAAAEQVEATGLVVKVQLQKTMSKQAQNDAASEVRQQINARVTSRGMRIEVRRDKPTGVLTITVTEGGGRDAAEVEKAIIAAVTRVRGFSNRVHG
jgi:hypothetical protein